VGSESSATQFRSQLHNSITCKLAIMNYKRIPPVHKLIFAGVTGYTANCYSVPHEPHFFIHDPRITSNRKVI